MRDSQNTFTNRNESAGKDYGDGRKLFNEVEEQKGHGLAKNQT